MANISHVNRLLEEFHEWWQPWKYIQSALAHQALKEAEMQLIDKLWAEATDAKDWLEPSFRLCEERIREKLTVTYPWLSTNAITSLIRGASYVRSK